MEIKSKRLNKIEKLGKMESQKLLKKLENRNEKLQCEISVLLEEKDELMGEIIELKVKYQELKKKLIIKKRYKRCRRGYVKWCKQMVCKRKASA